ncbi:MAG TPA: NAD(P)-dependent oxidoreductase [Chloroflexota bacterium]
MATLIVGGTGFIGSWVARQLVDAGERVVCFDATPRLDRLGDVASRVAVVRGDVTAIEEIIAAIREHRVRRVVHLAYYLPTPGREELQRAVKINVLGTNNIFEAARLCEVERVVYASSVAVYGRQESHGDRPIGEEDPPAPTGVYGASKWYNDFMAGQYARVHGLSVAGVRISVVAGHGRDSGSTLWASAMASTAALGKPVHVDFRAEQPVNIIYVQDAARIFTLLLRAERPRYTTYLSGGYTLTLGELAELVREIVPEARITFGTAEVPYAYRFDATRLREEFGFELPDLRQRLREHVEEARAQGS